MLQPILSTKNQTNFFEKLKSNYKSISCFEDFEQLFSEDDINNLIILDFFTNKMFNKILNFSDLGSYFKNIKFENDLQINTDKFIFKDIDFKLIPFIDEELKEKFLTLDFDGDVANKIRIIKILFSSIDSDNIFKELDIFDTTDYKIDDEDVFNAKIKFLYYTVRMVESEMLDKIFFVFNEKENLVYYDKDYYNFILGIKKVIKFFDFNILFDILNHFLENTNILPKVFEKNLIPLELFRHRKVFLTLMEIFKYIFDLTTDIYISIYKEYAVSKIRLFKEKHSKLLDELHIYIPEVPEFFDLVNEIDKLTGENQQSVLFLGDIGSGKTSFARLIHKLSNRCNEKFVEVSNAQLNSGNATDNWCGLEKKAYSNCAERAGFPEQANKGTLFIDEIGEIYQEIQGMMLTTLSEKKIVRLGSKNSNPRPADFRLISATTKSLDEFRPDFLSRIADVCITLPKLNSYINKIGIEFFRKLMHLAIKKIAPSRFNIPEVDIPMDFVQEYKESKYFHMFVYFSRCEFNIRGLINNIAEFLKDNPKFINGQFFEKIENNFKERKIAEVEPSQPKKKTGRKPIDLDMDKLLDSGFTLYESRIKEKFYYEKIMKNETIISFDELNFEDAINFKERGALSKKISSIEIDKGKYLVEEYFDNWDLEAIHNYFFYKSDYFDEKTKLLYKASQKSIYEKKHNNIKH